MNEKGLTIKNRITAEEIEKLPAVEKDPWRLRFHLMPPVGWLNDPNGLCQADGIYHVFFQYSPFDAKGKDKFWGHYTSRNLRDWEYRGAELVTDEDYDRNGVYSGCAFVENKKMYLFYTGNVKLEGNYDYILKGRKASVVVVESEDGVHFGEKQMLLTNEDYPSGYTQHVRDPKVLQRDGKYYMVLGGRTKNNRGRVLLYESEDLLSWEMKTELKASGEFGYMWECPDLFLMDGKWFLSLSPQGLPRMEYESQNIYTSGWFEVSGDFRTGCRLENFEEWDKGFDFYAPQTFRDESGRTMLIGWAGMPDAEKEYDNPTAGRGWQHALTVPRVITYLNGRLHQYPAPELRLLRGAALLVCAGETAELPEAFDLELKLKEEPAHLAVTIADGLRFVYDGREAVLSFADAGQEEGSFLGIGRGRRVRKARVTGLSQVRILADTSLVEIYLNRGETVFTTRYYPEGNQRSLLVEGNVEQLDCWEMHKMQVDYRAGERRIF